MSLIRGLVQYGSAQVSAKLGRCPKCMGLSLSGAVIGWVVVAGVAYFWPQFPFMNLLVLWPASFTSLWLLHIVTSAGRTVVSARQGREAVVQGQQTTVPVFSRRQVATVFVSGAALAIVASVGSVRQALGAGPCNECCNSNHSCPCHNWKCDISATKFGCTFGKCTTF